MNDSINNDTDLIINSGFIPFDIDTLDKESILEEEIFQYIFSIGEALERTKAIVKLQEKAKDLKVGRSFSNLLKAYQTDYVQNMKQKGSNSIQFTNPPLQGLKCGKWKADDGGVSKIEMTNFEAKTVSACSHPILPVERLINIDTETEKVKIAFYKDNRWQKVTVERSMVANKSNIIQLSDRGIEVNSDNAKDLVSYLAEVITLNAKEIPVSRSTDRLGWINGEFAPYTSNLKYDGDIAYKDVYESVKPNGDYETWKKELIKLRENKVMHLLIAASFASPLLNLIGSLPFVVHLWGGTGAGKTVALMVAMSVWGNPGTGKLVRTLNSTKVALARYTSFLHDIPMAGDELQIIKSAWENFDSLIMYLTEGIDRGRGKAYGGLEIQSTWQNVFLFTGEEPITKSNSGGGVKNRVIEIEATEKLVEDGNITASFVKDNYGHAGREFIECLPNKKVLQERYRQIFTQLLKEVDTTDKQAMAMAAILLADEISTDLIFKDKKLTIDDIRPYMHSSKEVDVSTRAYDLIIDWINSNAKKFNEDSPSEIWGKFQDNYCCINKMVLNKMLHDNGIDFEAIKKKLADDGKIERDINGKYTRAVKVSGKLGRYVKLLMPEDNDEGQMTLVYDEEIPF
ncbi:DUF927 domain-containing protein [Clostridium polynesiense]|uniref:DUF927 domain-containing protein n=1 Tax=Clostridium polynesiense TaxID=1325933 RepID=UPI0006936C9D|nr:DUF927 domain-containing protein [Clostridium polynesiense]